MSPSVSERSAAILLALESAALCALGAWQLVALVSGDVASPATSIALLVLTLVGVAALVAFAVGVWRDVSWGRSGGIVLQLLVLAVALGALTGIAGDALIALWIALPAFLTLGALVRATIVSGRRAPGSR